MQCSLLTLLFNTKNTHSINTLGTTLHRYESPRAAALSHLLIKLLDDALCETAYLAEVAGLHYGIW